jgi:glycosyltransferase involved in cell wall biosynthesis
MKILVCLTRVPYPLNKGDKLRAFNQIKELSKTNDIYLFCLNNSKVEKQTIDILSKYCKEIHIENISKISSCINILKSIFTKMPLQVAFYTKKSAIKTFVNAFEKVNPDVSYFQFIRTGEYIKKIQGKKVLDFQDCLSMNMERRGKVSKGVLRYVLLKEAKRLQRYEDDMFRMVSKTTIIAKPDKDNIRSKHKDEIEIIGNGVGEEYFSYPNNNDKEFDIIFSGNMSYAPNVLAAKFLIKEVMPIVWKKKKDAKIVIAGSSPKKEIVDMQNKNVIVTGWVKDMKEYYSKSKIFIAPMQIGTGLQNKLLEAMAMGLPCITTSLANKALMAQKDQDILIANTKQEMAESIFTLLENKNIYSTLSINGKQYVRNNFSWEFSTNKLSLIFQQLTKA